MDDIRCRAWKWVHDASVTFPDIPRFRSYMLMGEFGKVSDQEIEERVSEMVKDIYMMGCDSVPPFRPDSCVSEYSSKTEWRRKKFIDENGEFRWNLIHGDDKKAMKFAVKNVKKKVRNFYDIYNKYAGNKDVICIRARIGGNNWIPYGGDLIEREDWFIEKIDDYFDDTYCYIYIKLMTSSEQCTEEERQ